MAGILYKGDNPGIESTGVYKGVLSENMIDTVSRVKKPFIDVYIESLFFKDADYPLTYVPMFNMVLPLKKDQEVYVYFNQGNHRYPVLWKLAADVGDEYIEKFNLPSNGSMVSFPSAEDTTEVTKFSDSCWFIGTKSYGVFHWGEQCILLNDDSVIINAKSKLHLKSGGDFKFESKDDFTMESTSGNVFVNGLNGIAMESVSGKITLKGMSQDLGTILHDVFNDVASTTPTTQGSPAAQVFNPQIIAALLKAVTLLSMGFKE